MHPEAAVRLKGWAVRPLKQYVSWVQNVVNTSTRPRKAICVKNLPHIGETPLLSEKHKKGNPEGSRIRTLGLNNKRNSIKIMKTPKKQTAKFSKELRDIAHGYLMSDGYVTPAGALSVDQCVEQEKFVEWLYEKLKSLRTDTPIQTVTRTHRKTGIKTESRRFHTRVYLKGFRSMWYKTEMNANGREVFVKRLPKSLDCFFNETFITLWFAGDGTRTRGNQQSGSKFEVTNYTPDERLRLKKLFGDKFGIATTICKAGLSITGTQQYTLNISAPDYPKFRNLITQMDLITNLFPNKLCKKP